jgi:hypothetical protein
MEFPYELVPSMVSGYLSLQPRAPIVFTNPANGRSMIIKALVDSGAGMTVLHPRFAKRLGIDLTTLPERPFSSADNDMVGYDYDLQIRLKGDRQHEYLIPCSFLLGLRTDAVLGRDGFFDHYRIVFEQYRNRFELTPQ